MTSLYKRPLYIALSALLTNGIIASPVFAEPIYHPSGPKLTFGGMTHRRMTVSDMGNPAHPAGVPYPEGDNGLYGAGLSLGLGVEYDGNDNLFKLLDNASDSGASVPGGDSGTGDSGEDSATTLPIPLPGVSLTPEQQDQLDSLVQEVAVAAALIGVSVTGLNAKAFISADVPVLISNNKLGTWTFGANTSITTNLRGINDPITFDATQALDELIKAYEADPPTVATTYDLTGSASVTVNPDGTAKFRIDNNSGVITKAAQVTEISIGYSRKVWQQEDNKVYIGIKPKYLDIGLSNTAIPIANIDNAKSIFESLDKSDFSYQQDFSVDLGAIWSGKQYQVGATLTNLNEPEFHYPASDLSGFTNPLIIQFIRDRERYVMERQLKLDGGYITPGGAWGINFGLDVNAVPDPMGDDYQWAAVGVGFASDSWWLPGARAGIRKNMAGTELTYVTAGVTVFNILNLDLAATTQTVQINGKTVPRGLIGNIGFQVMF
ncbi:MAG: conjugal transfer protein TraF [Proteobacteria bacterium]|nr:conjugal transfer protein TraF [Pseudomonadota bacterium]